MASWMIHLRVAQQLYRQLNIESANEFVLGNIAPDSGIPAEDGTGFVPEKSISHFYAWDRNGIKYIDEGLFIQQYFTPEHRFVYTKEEDSFFFGYLTHLLTDKIWAREIVLPAKERQNELYRSNPELFWDTIKTDWYNMDFMYLKSNPSFEAFQIYRRIKNLKNTYMDIFPENAFEERRQFVLDFYANGAANIEEHSTYLSKEELDVFVTSAVNEIMEDLRCLNLAGHRKN